MSSKEKRSKGLIKRMVLSTVMIAMLIIPEIALADGGGPHRRSQQFFGFLIRSGESIRHDFNRIWHCAGRAFP